MKNSEAILVTPKQFEIQECPVPEPKDHEILMKVEYVGMCGSDIHGFEFGPFIPPKDPNQKIGLGHEVAGEVVKVGSKVTRFKAGDKVLIEPVFRMTNANTAVQADTTSALMLTLWLHSLTTRAHSHSI